MADKNPATDADADADGKDPGTSEWDKIQKLLKEAKDENFKGVLQQAIDTVEKTFGKYKPEEVGVCFNGSKDSTVMLHLTYSYFAKEFPEKGLQTIYIRPVQPIKHVDTFMLDMEKRYKLDAVNLDGPMKPALCKMLEQRPAVKACVLGTRINGPAGAKEQDLFSPTDGDWPKVMRVNPLLHWRHEDVVSCVRGLAVQYPSLYDRKMDGADERRPRSPLRYNSRSRHRSRSRESRYSSRSRESRYSSRNYRGYNKSDRRRKEEEGCWLCGEAGHKAWSCRKNKRRNFEGHVDGGRGAHGGGGGFSRGGSRGGARGRGGRGNNNNNAFNNKGNNQENNKRWNNKGWNNKGWNKNGDNGNNAKPVTKGHQRNAYKVVTSVTKFYKD